MGKEWGLRILVAILAAALIAWGLLLILNTSAYAHTLPMGEIKRGISQLVQEKLWPQQVVVGLGRCHRIGKHGGRCAIRAYTIPDRTKWCGVGTAKLVGRNHRGEGGKTWADMRVYGAIRPCIGPTRQREPYM